MSSQSTASAEKMPPTSSVVPADPALANYLPSQPLFDRLFRDRVLAARRVSPEQRVILGLEHSDACAQVMLDGIKDQFPQTTREEQLEILKRRLEYVRRLENRS